MSIESELQYAPFLRFPICSIHDAVSTQKPQKTLILSPDPSLGRFQYRLGVCAGVQQLLAIPWGEKSGGDVQFRKKSQTLITTLNKLKY